MSKFSPRPHFLESSPTITGSTRASSRYHGARTYFRGGLGVHVGVSVGLSLLLLLLLSACAGSRTVGAERPAGAPVPGAPQGTPPTAAVTGATEMQRLFRSMGLIAGSGSIPFVASASFLTAPAADRACP